MSLGSGAALAGFWLCLFATQAWAGDLKVAVTGLRNGEGQVRICLWNKPDGFPDCSDHAPFARAAVPAQSGKLFVDFGDVAPGAYAVSVFHDEKNTGRVETNFLGIPRSGLGASNNARGRFGPPSFQDAAVPVGPAPTTIVVSVEYP